jgi:hypothetical protein
MDVFSTSAPWRNSSAAKRCSPLLAATDFAALLVERRSEQLCLFHERLYHTLLVAEVADICVEGEQRKAFWERLLSLIVTLPAALLRSTRRKATPRTSDECFPISVILVQLLTVILLSYTLQ